MWMAPIRSAIVDQKLNQYEGAMDDWYCFLEDTRSFYGVDMSVLTRPFDEEQKRYYLHVSTRIYQTLAMVVIMAIYFYGLGT